MAPTFPILERNAYSIYPMPVPLVHIVCITGRQIICSVSQVHRLRGSGVKELFQGPEQHWP